MNRLEQLLNDLCPDRVEYKTIGDIATDIYRGSGIKREDVTEQGVQCVRYGEIYTTYRIWFDECVSHTTLEKVSSPKWFEYGDILFVITGESVEDIAKSTAYVGHEKCLAGGDIVVLKHNQNPKYLSYALSTADANKQKSAGKVKSKVVHSSVPSIKSITVPVPPLEVQAEVVRILDKFTELEAELEARKKQYEYYRDSLLNFNHKSGGVIRWIKLGEVAKVTKLAGFEFTKYVQYSDSGEIVALRGLNVKNGQLNLDDVKYIDESDLSKLGRSKLYVGDMLFTYVGTVGQVALIDKNDRYYLAPNVAMIRTESKNIEPKFLLHYFQSNFFKTQQMNHLLQSSSMKNIPMEKIRKIIVPIPPLEVQERIVKVLDNFEAICGDFQIGLPAEIEARQGQYEYYRDKLLSFRELS